MYLWGFIVVQMSSREVYERRKGDIHETRCANMTALPCTTRLRPERAVFQKRMHTLHVPVPSGVWRLTTRFTFGATQASTYNVIEHRIAFVYGTYNDQGCKQCHHLAGTTSGWWMTITYHLSSGLRAQKYWKNAKACPHRDGTGTRSNSDTW